MTNSQVDRDSALPLYHQVLEKVRASIRTGEYAPGSKIPPERELCHLLGVSRITVIKALNTLAQEGLLIKRAGLGTFVADAFPSMAGSSIGLVAPLLRGDTFFDDIVTGAESALSERDLSLILSFSHGTAEGEWRCMNRLLEQRAAGLILYMADVSSSWNNIHRFTRNGTPLVLIDNRAPALDESFNTVTSDNLKGAFLAVGHLAKLGHRRIGLLTQHKRRSSVIDREAAYRLALLEAGIPFDPALVYTITDQYENAWKAVDGWLALDQPPTALFAINDVLAHHSMRALLQKGIRIPEQFSVVGFDDNTQASHSHPPLTTVRQQREAMGRTAVDILLDRLSGKATHPRHEVLDVELIVRQSSGPAPFR